MGQDGHDIRQETSAYAVRTVVTVPVSAQRAFDTFTDGLAGWWMREYTWSGPDALVDIGIEPAPGGKAYEIGPYGFRLDWGRVLTWSPPDRVHLTWQIGADRVPVPDPGHGSEIEVTFVPSGRNTVVTVDHRHFDRHGDDAEGYRDALTAGWQELVSRYADRVTDGPRPAG
jgi:uncharacterized protein YndB with AHSA1/START domain